MKSCRVEINGKSVKVTSLSSLKSAHKICGILRDWIAEGEFTLTQHVEKLPTDTPVRPMKPLIESVGGDD